MTEKLMVCLKTSKVYKIIGVNPNTKRYSCIGHLGKKFKLLKDKHKIIIEVGPISQMAGTEI